MSLTNAMKANARNLPNYDSTVMGARKRTWTETLNRVSMFASGLKELGVSEGARIAILSLNSDRFYESMYGTWWFGGVSVPLNIRFPPAELIGVLNDSGAEVLLIDDTFMPMHEAIKSNVASLKTVISLGDSEPPEGATTYENLLANATEAEEKVADDEDLAILMYTGGTTGAPKGVMLTHGALKFNALACSAHGSYFANDLYLHAAPMFHIADNANSGAASLFGAGHIFIPAFEPALVMNTIAEHKVTCTVLVPTMIGMILDHPEFQPEKLSSLRRLIYGASPMPEALLRRLLEIFPEMELVQGYGMTEMGPLISILPNEDHILTGEHTKRLKSAGRPAAGVDVKVCDEDGIEVKQGEVGEIVINSPGHMLGYWNKEDATAEVLKDDWVFSGDCGYFDEDGFLYIVDRKKDMIVTGGENVYSAEVENAISLHPDVAGVAVIGVPSDKWGEIVHAIVIPKTDSNVTEESIIEHTRKLVANYKIPRKISFREEPFPLSGAGKVLKKDLRAPFWEGQEPLV